MKVTERSRSTRVLLGNAERAGYRLFSRIEQATATVPGDDFVGGEFGEQKWRKRVGEHRQDARGKSPPARGSGIEEEPVHREGPTVEPPLPVPEADARFTCSSRDAEPDQLVVGQLLRGGKANRTVAGKSGRRDRGAGAKASAAVVDDERNAIGVRVSAAAAVN